MRVLKIAKSDCLLRHVRPSVFRMELLVFLTYFNQIYITLL